MANKIPVTQEFYDMLSAELSEIRTVKVPENEQAIKVAREHGDLSENADYDAAKDEQGRLHARATEIEQVLDSVEVVSLDNIDTSCANLFTVVKAENTDNGKIIEIRLTSDIEADRQAKPQKISIESPLGSAILGSKVGDDVTVFAPAGEIEYNILKISK